MPPSSTGPVAPPPFPHGDEKPDRAMDLLAALYQSRDLEQELKVARLAESILESCARQGGTIKEIVTRAYLLASETVNTGRVREELLLRAMKKGPPTPGHYRAIAMDACLCCVRVREWELPTSPVDDGKPEETGPLNEAVFAAPVGPAKGAREELADLVRAAVGTGDKDKINAALRAAGFTLKDGIWTLAIPAAQEDEALCGELAPGGLRACVLPKGHGGTHASVSAVAAKRGAEA